MRGCAYRRAYMYLQCKWEIGPHGQLVLCMLVMIRSMALFFVENYQSHYSFTNQLTHFLALENVYLPTFWWHRLAGMYPMVWMDRQMLYISEPKVCLQTFPWEISAISEHQYFFSIQKYCMLLVLLLRCKSIRNSTWTSICWGQSSKIHKYNKKIKSWISDSFDIYLFHT